MSLIIKRAFYSSFFTDKVRKQRDSAKRTSSFTLIALFAFHFSWCFAQNEATLLFVGDLMQHSPQFMHARQPDGTFNYDVCFEEVKPYIEAADIAIGNLEVTLGGPPYTGYPCFSAPDDWLWAIKKTGFDVLTTSNNHCLDRGKRGLERTLMMTDSAGILTLGTYRNAEERQQRYPLLVEQNGIRFAFITYTYDMNGFEVEAPNVVNVIDTTQMKRDILVARTMHPDVIIAIMHWGTEYKLLPDSYQRFHGQWLLEHGVDHIIGGHPHVIQPTEYLPYADKPDYHLVVWSQGNFISNMSAPHTTEGTMITLTFRKTGLITRLTEYDCKVVQTTRPDYRLKIID
ncbi:MAG: CapA family protein [Bacteroidaceae bacterium]|nr:CapA family protein [Bacteroidaceae bacterium]